MDVPSILERLTYVIVVQSRTKRREPPEFVVYLDQWERLNAVLRVTMFSSTQEHVLIRANVQKSYTYDICAPLACRLFVGFGALQSSGECVAPGRIIMYCDLDVHVPVEGRPRVLEDMFRLGYDIVAFTTTITSAAQLQDNCERSSKQLNNYYVGTSVTARVRNQASLCDN